MIPQVFYTCVIALLSVVGIVCVDNVLDFLPDVMYRLFAAVLVLAAVIGTGSALLWVWS